MGNKIFYIFHGSKTQKRFLSKRAGVMKSTGIGLILFFYYLRWKQLNWFHKLDKYYGFFRRPVPNGKRGIPKS